MYTYSAVWSSNPLERARVRSTLPCTAVQHTSGVSPTVYPRRWTIRSPTFWYAWSMYPYTCIFGPLAGVLLVYQTFGGVQHPFSEAFNLRS